MKRIGRKSGWFNVAMLHPEKPSHTLIKQDRGCTTLYHWTGRHISIREALVLTGFPQDFNLPGTFAERWARIGNSVAPSMTREIARQVLIPLLGAWAARQSGGPHGQ
jgi:site-specific DNA-cytosine methylase